MKSSKLQRLFSTTTWRGWLQTLPRWEEAMNFDEFDFLERRIRNLEGQVSELRSQRGKP